MECRTCCNSITARKLAARPTCKVGSIVEQEGPRHSQPALQGRPCRLLLLLFAGDSKPDLRRGIKKAFSEALLCTGKRAGAGAGFRSHGAHPVLTEHVHQEGQHAGAQHTTRESLQVT